jgi:hypothetical protein
VLELRPNCELCDYDLPPASDKARICTYECTFCVECAKNVLHGVCPNCGGNFVPRPIRPTISWRAGTGLAKHPASSKRRSNGYSTEERATLSEHLRDVAPDKR